MKRFACAAALLASLGREREAERQRRKALIAGSSARRSAGAANKGHGSRAKAIEAWRSKVFGDDQ